MKLPVLIKIMLLLLALALAAGCSKKEESGPISQVAAKVNADEITVSQINNVMSSAQNLTPEATQRARAEGLEKLIEQQLAKQQAIATKLDRTSQVVQATEAARDEVLARTDLEKIAAVFPKPTSDDIKKYYVGHPELFAQRRVFNLEELVVEPKDGLATVLKQQVANAKTLQDVATWLRSQNINFSANQGVRAAEALPFELLPNLQALKADDMLVIEGSGGRLNVFRIVAFQSAPVDEATAMPRIEQFLFNQRVTKTLTAELKSLRVKSDIAYFGEFGGSSTKARGQL